MTAVSDVRADTQIGGFSVLGLRQNQVGPSTNLREVTAKSVGRCPGMLVFS
jgi:hypothetical protein